MTSTPLSVRTWVLDRMHRKGRCRIYAQFQPIRSNASQILGFEIPSIPPPAPEVLEVHGDYAIVIWFTDLNSSTPARFTIEGPTTTEVQREAIEHFSCRLTLPALELAIENICNYTNWSDKYQTVI